MQSVLVSDSVAWIYLLLFMVSVVAGVVDAIAGGGGLITVPALMLAGLPPMVVLGTNRLQAVIGELTTSLMFIVSRQLPVKGLVLGAVFTSVGAILGTFSVNLIDKRSLEILLPVLMGCVAIYSLLSNRLKATEEAEAKWHTSYFMVSGGLLIGFYNGFFGPGTGSIWMLAFVVLLGYTIKQATMATKPLNLIGNVISLILFIYLGQLHYQIGLLMGAGQIIGSVVGSRWVLFFGTRLVRPVFISVALLMTTKLIYENVSLLQHY